jgi:glycerol-3-phosphate dehydrogenase
MAQDTLNKAMRAGLLERRPCRTQQLPLNGFALNDRRDRTYIYGSHAHEIRKMTDAHPEWARTLHPRLPYTEAELRWICRHERPRKLEDLLARRIRALFLDAAASREMAADAASIMAEELGMDGEWVKQEVEEYTLLVENYIC